MNKSHLTIANKFECKKVVDKLRASVSPCVNMEHSFFTLRLKNYIKKIKNADHLSHKNLDFSTIKKWVFKIV